MNHFQTSGVLMAISLPNEEEAKRGRAGSCVIRYGGRRDGRSNAPRQFVNATPMRIPSKLVKNFRAFRVGQVVEVMGRTEGIIEKSVSGQQFHSVQLVANIIRELDLTEMGFETPKPAKSKDKKPPVGASEVSAEHHDMADEDPDDVAQAA